MGHLRGRSARGKQEEKASPGNAQSYPLQGVQTEGSLEAGLAEKAEQKLRAAYSDRRESRRMTGNAAVTQPGVRGEKQQKSDGAGKQSDWIEWLSNASTDRNTGVGPLGKVTKREKSPHQNSAGSPGIQRKKKRKLFPAEPEPGRHGRQQESRGSKRGNGE